MGKLRKLFSRPQAAPSGQDAFSQALIALVCQECDECLSRCDALTPDAQADQRILDAVLRPAQEEWEDTPPEKLRRVHWRALLIAALLAAMLLVASVSASLIIRYRVAFHVDDYGTIEPIFTNEAEFPKTEIDLTGLKPSSVPRGFFKKPGELYHEMGVAEIWINRDGQRISFLSTLIIERSETANGIVSFGGEIVGTVIVKGVEVTIIDQGKREAYLWRNDRYLYEIAIDKSMDDIHRARLIYENIR